MHLIGAVADLSFLFRVKSHGYYYRAYSLALLIFYTVFWSVWLVWLHLMRYRRLGQVCSGDYLEQEEALGYDFKEGYAIR